MGRSRLSPSPLARSPAVALGALSHDPRQVGKPLREPFLGQWPARRATYRVIYTIDEDKHLVIIYAVLPRGTAYRAR
jgi:mRNA interferase RelE/StbE